MAKRPRRGLFLTRTNAFGRGKLLNVLASRDGVAALEFALIVVILVIMALGLYDLTSAFILWRRLTQSAQSISEMTTRLAAAPSVPPTIPPANPNTLAYSDALLASTAISVIVPGPVSPGVEMAVVQFAASPPNCVVNVNCSYTGSATWSRVMQGAVPATIKPYACGTYRAGGVGQPAGQGVLPNDAFQPSSILIVQVWATYTPLFIKFFTGAFTLSRTAYLPPRTGAIADSIQITGAPGGTICP